MDISSAKRTALLTLGRLPVALELARALHAHGWRVIVAEPFGWHLCRLSNSVNRSFKVIAPTADAAAYLSQIETIILHEQVSLVIPVSEETLFVAALKERLPDTVRLLCMSQENLLQLHDKYRFYQLAVQQDLPVPPTALASDTPACRFITKMPFVIKPRLSCSGAGVRFATAGSELLAQETNDRHIVQQHLAGPACCSFTIASAGQVLVSVCYRGLIESGTVSVCFEQIALPEAVGYLIKGIVASTGYSGMIAFDFIQDGEGVWRAIECNPRATSGLHFLESSDIHSAMIHNKITTPSPLSGKRQEFWSSLIQVEGALFRGVFDKAGWCNLFTSKDITWRVSDIKPFLLMSFVLAPQLFKAMRSGKPVSEILMNDVGWHDARR